MEPFTLGAAAVGLGAASGLANTYMQWQNLNWQKSVQNKMFNREDSSIQRRVADLKAAGLSPVLAAGQGASAGPVVSTHAPELPQNTGQQILDLMRMKNEFETSATQRALMQSQAKLADANAKVAGTVGRIKGVEANTVEDSGNPGQSQVGKTLNDLTGTFNTFVDRVTGKKSMPGTKEPIKGNAFTGISSQANKTVNQIINKTKSKRR